MRITLQEFIKRHKDTNPYTNYDYSLTVLGKTVHDKVRIICPIHGVFEQAPHEHMKGQGCPKCCIELSKKIKTRSVEEFVKMAKEKHGDKYYYSPETMGYINMKSKCTIKCNEHNIYFEVTPQSHLKGNGGCPLCWHKSNIENKLREDKEKELKRIKNEKRKLEKQIKIEKRRQVRENKIANTKNRLISELAMIDSDEVRKIIEEIKKNDRSFLSTSEREIVRREKQKIFVSERKKKFLEKAHLINEGRYDLSMITMFTKVQDNIILVCHKQDEHGVEHGAFKIQANSFLLGHGCPKCSKLHHYTTKEYIAKCQNIHGETYSYDRCVYINARTDVEIKCNKCGEYFKQKPTFHLYGGGCPYCKSSKLESLLSVCLTNRNIIYERQKRFDWLGRQSLDFYLPEYNIAIECQGVQHFEAFGFFTEEMVVKAKERDARKKQLLKENNVELVYYFNNPRWAKYMQFDDIFFTKKDELLEYIFSHTKLC